MKPSPTIRSLGERLKASLSTLQTVLLGIASLALGAALGLYAYLGTFSRYLADDYCLTAGFLDQGFWTSQIALYRDWSPRYSVAFLINLSELFGRGSIRVWTALIVVLWLAALAWAILQVFRQVRLKLSLLQAFFLSGLLLFYTILEAPNRYQALYWRVGLVTYTVPLIFLALLVGMILHFSGQAETRKRSLWLRAGLVALTAWFAGGFSETYVTLQTGLLAFGMLAVWVFLRGEKQAAWRTLVSAAFLGSLIALAIVIAAPGNAVRLSAMPERAALVEIARMAVKNAFLFLYMSLEEYAFQNVLLVLVTLGLSASLFARANASRRLDPAALTFSLFLVPVLAYVLILAICTPSAYAQSSYPEGRVLIEARFVMTVMLACLGTLLGLLIAQLFHWSGQEAPFGLHALLLGSFLLASLYPLYEARKNVAQIPVFQERAGRWEEHAATIRGSAEQGVFEVNLLDSQAVTFDAFSGLLEPSSDPQDWVNQCAASFFGMSSLTVNAP
jgi:hypothetical protein